MTPDEPAAEHRVVAGLFGERVAGVGAADAPGWSAPAPVEGWTARDVVRHLVEWFPGLLSSAGISLPPVDVDDDPVAAWRQRSADVQALLDSPDVRGRTFEHPHIPAMPLDRMVSRFYTADVFLHTWDLARATGQDERLDPGRCAVMLAGMEPLDEVLRASGQYGPKVEVPAGADAQTRLLGFIGRNP
ncbi:TIGR03086 family metal-binding protein [Nocardioides sambongensis]|uniref:TIGR03086 family metal-binding protein n=1 Tax=Nocardioides sambongensis TaxID=2589074 RepID=UPI0015E85BA0|nr:TIGR03086 family metal-binding protein [Nocardioides sambongensis]